MTLFSSRIPFLRPAVSLSITLTAAIGMLASAHAQDTRTVTEPVFPAVCSTLTAQLTETNNLLPSADETLFDTTRVQDALNACASGQAVELALDAGGSNAFLIQPISIPTGVTLLVDAGVTVYGSRNPRDYDSVANECGTVASYSNGCNPLISAKHNNSGIMGYGVIDGRGGQTLIGPGAPTNTTWWQLASQADTESLNQNNPYLLNVDSNNFTLYKITLQNSPMFHVNYEGTGFTAWDVKIIAPGTARNTDGIDPGPAHNITIANSYIGDGDDNVALKPGGNAVAGGTVSDVSILNNHFYVGHGMSIGSQTSGGATSILVQNLNIDGDSTNGSDTGIRIKAQSSNGGLVNGVTYSNVCMQNVESPIQFNPFYSSSTGSEIPQFENITLSNVTVLTPGNVLLDGYSASYPLGLTLDNVNFAPSLPANDLSAKNANVTLGPGPVNLPLASSSANDVTVTNDVTNTTEAPFACSSANFPLLAPELFASAAQVAPGDSVTLTAIFEPVIESPTTFSATEPTGSVTVYDGTTSVGSVSLSGSSDLVTLPVANVSSGTHTYTAVYSGDSNYARMTSSAFVVTTSGAAATTTTLTPSSTSIYASQTVDLTATISSGAGTPTGSVTFYDGITPLATQDLAGGLTTYTATLSIGVHNLTASYTATTDFASSTSSSVAVTVSSAATTTTLTPSTTSTTTDQAVTLTATVTSPGGTPSGSISFYDGSTLLATQTLSSGSASYAATFAAGPHSLTGAYIATTDFAGSTSAPVTVTATVPILPTTTTLRPSSAAVNAGQSVTITATVSAASGTPDGTVTFYDGATALITSPLTSGAASYTAPLATGDHSLTAAYTPTSNASFSASTSAVASVSVQDFAFSASPASLTIAPGGSANTTLTFTSMGSLAGTIAYSCSGLPAYVSCPPGSVALTSSGPATAVVTFSVALTTSASAMPWLLPLVAFLFAFIRRAPRANHRRRWQGIAMLCLLASVISLLSGCGGSSSSSNSTGNTPPSGQQTATITASITTAAGVITHDTNVTITVQ